jgi:hypothetical protein
MRFETFDRDAGREAVPEGPLVKVSQQGQVLLCPQAWAFLLPPGAGPVVRNFEVVLMFDPETRTAAVRPVGPDEAAGARWQVAQMRSQEWPRGMAAKEFVDHYKVAMGKYLARLVREPGPRMVTFSVGEPRALPSGRPPEGSVEGVVILPVDPVANGTARA